MKACSYCGEQNEDVATQCRKCGTALPTDQAAAPPPVPPVGPGGQARPQSATPSEPAKTSGLAITSLIMGILGGCGITALAGLICGIIGLVQIDKSNGRLKGRGMAIAGLVLSGVSLLMIPILAGLMLPALAKAKARAQRVNCVNNLKQLALAVRMYASDQNNRFPTAEKWCDAITPYAANPKVFHCAASTSSGRSTYAFNAKLSNMSEGKIDPNTVMLFEIEDGWNVSGGEDLMLQHDPHGGGWNVAFADGSVQQLSKARAQELKWDP